MKYFYNYSFLNKWMEANSKITNREIMKAMGTTSNACLDSWIRMKSPLPTIAMLRFCNAFHIPLSAFIVDADKDQQGSEGCCEDGYVCPGIDVFLCLVAEELQDIESVPEVCPVGFVDF